VREALWEKHGGGEAVVQAAVCLHTYASAMGNAYCRHAARGPGGVREGVVGPMAARKFDVTDGAMSWATRLTFGDRTQGAIGAGAQSFGEMFPGAGRHSHHDPTM